jgi:hypothetical protein
MLNNFKKLRIPHKIAIPLNENVNIIKPVRDKGEIPSGVEDPKIVSNIINILIT